MWPCSLIPACSWQGGPRLQPGIELMSRPAVEAEGIRPLHGADARPGRERGRISTACRDWMPYHVGGTQAGGHNALLISSRPVTRAESVRTALVLALLAVSVSPKLVGQAASVRLSPATPSRALLGQPRLAVLDSAGSARQSLDYSSLRGTDYRWELGVAGAALVGLVGLVGANAGCNADSTSGSCVGPVVGTAVVGALIGGVIGLFVGSAIDKPLAPQPPSPAAN